MTRCECAPDGDSYLCVCPCGARLRSNKPTVFHVCESPAQALVSGGPGTELKALLKGFGIVAKPGCSCNSRAAFMDQMEAKEPGWCERNLDQISGWLADEAKKRGLPYFPLAGKTIVRLAVRKARQKDNS